MADYLGSRTVKKTRKPHKCEWCPEIIQIGEPAQTITWAEDGAADRFYWHPECHKVAGSYQNFDPHWEFFEQHSQKRGVEYTEN